MTISLTDVGSGYKRSAINSNFTTIENEINNNLLSKNGGVGLEADLDANSQKVINLADGVNNKDAVNLQQLNGAIAAAGSGLIASQIETQKGSSAVSRVFTFTGITYTVGGNNLLVFQNGVKLAKGRDYTETSSSSITIDSAVIINPGDDFDFITNVATTNSTTDTSAITHTESGTDYNLATYLQNRHVVNVKDFGAVGDNVTDDYAAIQAALDSGAAVVYFPEPSSGRYLIGTGLAPPNGVTLIGDGSRNTRLRYTGTTTAIAFGESATVLNKGCAMRGIKIELEDKTSRAILLRGTDTAVLEEVEIEGLYTPYDNTRTNIGVQIDGANVSSFFNMLKNVKCNHVHECFTIQTTGTLQSTCNYFLNCTALADQATDDSGYGFRIGDGGTVVQEGQGSVISGGNVELCNTGFKIGNRAGSITIQGVRIEITGTGTAWKFDFVDGCDPCTLVGNQGLGNSYMEANSGIRNWDSANHTLIGDDNGSLRLAGFDGALNNTQFIGIGGTNPEFRHDANSELYIYSMGDATDTGRTLIQQGFGSASHGGHIDLSGASHPTRPGDCTLGPSSTTGSFKVNHGLNGTTQLEVDRDSTAGNTRLLIWDVDNATLERVSVGAADSGGTGFKVLRIPN